VTTTELSPKDGLTCRAYVVWNNEPVTDYFLSMGGTGTGTSAFVPESFREVLATRAAAFVTFDKPGVTGTFGDPSTTRIDDAPFKRHTQGTLLDCAEQAMHLSARSGSETRWHLRGHSEGAQIALALVDRLLTERPADAERVKTLVLSGLSLEPFGDILRRQLADKPRLARAVDECDWNIMRQAMGLSCDYVQDAGNQPSGFDLFRRLAATSSKVPIRVFQGNRDVNTPADFVRQLEAWNAADGHLDLTVRYYDGAHAGTPEAQKEVSELLVKLVARAQE
jgi:pimeloyl-ACP methyl ester carboxylesterase